MNTEKSVESFATLFEQHAGATPSGQQVRVGDRLDGTVVQVGRDSVFVELDGKRQAFIDAAELRAPDGTMTVKMGDKLTAQVVEVDPRTNSVRLGRSLGKPSSLAVLEQALEAGIAIEGKVAGVNKGGLQVDLDGVRAFCPISQVDIKFVSDPSVFVGRTLQFFVTEIREGGRSVVLSRRLLLEREAHEAAERLLKDLVPGIVVRGTVTSVRDFGAFVDLGGLEGLIPASEISYDRVVTVGDALKAGDVVEVQVREIREAMAQRQGEQGVRITLSLKALSVDPWDGIETVAPEGKVVIGSVTRLTDFGAFVRLVAGIEGLLHVSELGGKVDHPAKALKVGQQIAVVIKKIDREAKKVSLVPAPEGLGAGASVQKLQLAIGVVVNGTVDRLEPYGVFVQLDGTRGRSGRGLIPNADLGVPRGADVHKLFPEGTRVTAKVIETGEGRLRLSIRALREDEERANYDGYREKAGVPTKLGTLGDLLHKKRGR